MGLAGAAYGEEARCTSGSHPQTSLPRQAAPDSGASAERHIFCEPEKGRDPEGPRPYPLPLDRPSLLPRQLRRTLTLRTSAKQSSRKSNFRFTAF